MLNKRLFNLLLCLTLGQSLPIVASAQQHIDLSAPAVKFHANTTTDMLKLNPPQLPHVPPAPQRHGKAFGGGDTGGGDAYVTDFLSIANHEVLPILLNYGSLLSPAVDPSQFAQYLDPQVIESANYVYESCRHKDMQRPQKESAKRGREVMGCYNESTDRIYLNRHIYPLDSRNSSAKQLFIAHEIFRRMGIESDQYEVSRQIPMLNTERSQMDLMDEKPILYAHINNRSICDIKVQYQAENGSLSISPTTSIDGVETKNCDQLAGLPATFHCVEGGVSRCMRMNTHESIANQFAGELGVTVTAETLTLEGLSSQQFHAIIAPSDVQPTLQ